MLWWAPVSCTIIFFVSNGILFFQFPSGLCLHFLLHSFLWFDRHTMLWHCIFNVSFLGGGGIHTLVLAWFIDVKSFTFLSIFYFWHTILRTTCQFVHYISVITLPFSFFIFFTQIIFFQLFFPSKQSPSLNIIHSHHPMIAYSYSFC